MPPEDFEDWFEQVKHLARAPRLRPADEWCGGETWQDAFLECLTPAEALAGISIQQEPRFRVRNCPKLRALYRLFKQAARSAGDHEPSEADAPSTYEASEPGRGATNTSNLTAIMR
jgi:hypothetical protein